MALLNDPNRQFTEEEIQLLLQMPLPTHLHSMARDFLGLREPTPPYVRYEATFSWFAYVRPGDFYWRSTKSPSDCDWIVPGTLKDTSDL